jgi:hypothetical protein
MPVPCYKPVKERRYFNRVKKYSEIDWNNEVAVYRELQLKLDDWYVRPAKALTRVPHAAFSVLALTCGLIDTLSQFEAGVARGTRTIFRNWVRKHFKNCARPFGVPIKESATSASIAARDYADALYFAFRCGVLHQSHSAVYSGIVGQKRTFSYHRRGLTTYGDNTPCPTVIIDPARLLKRVLAVYRKYFKKLLDSSPAHASLRQNFKAKFFAGYGIDIGNEH